MASKSNTHGAYRSAITGHFVTPAYAARHHKTTVHERVPNPKPAKAGK
jgi:hypothetical protein